MTIPRIKRRTLMVITLLITLLNVGCNTMRYVPKNESLLAKNRVELNEPKETKIDKEIKLKTNDLADFIKQKPNRRLLGLGIYLGFYNITDTAKHNKWHKFWSQKVGEAPVILDSTLVSRSTNDMEIYLESRGFLNAKVEDTIEINAKRKATVTYKVTTEQPFTISAVEYNIKDDFIKPIIERDTINSVIKVGAIFERSILESERSRISDNLRNVGFWGFNQNYITYIADSTHGSNTVSLKIEINQLTIGRNLNQEPIYTNHPIYRIKNITLNSNYDPSISVEELAKVRYDTILCNGVDVVYRGKLLLKEKVLLRQLGMSPGEIFSQQGIEKTYTNIRSLDLNPQIVFNPLPVDSSDIVYVTEANGKAMTTQRELNCLVQCTPNVRQNFSVGFEASTTDNYYSLALQFGYQNRNLLRGAENFTVSLRGAYEFMKNQGENGSFEFGINTSLSIPRFWLPISPEKMREFKYSSTNLSLGYSIQRRPFYERSILSAVYGYGWTLKNGARFTINPADINLVNVPWADSTFIADIENPYLANSYESQLIAGLSATYSYNTNENPKADGFTFNVMGDFNGNLFYGLNSLFGATKHSSPAGDTYYNLFGLRFAQYARVIADVSNRVNVSERVQIAWRFMIGGGYAYGNSQTLPFERLFFAGGSNSMRGWQVRTLGPGSVLINDYGEHPNQLGDMKLEANLEFRFNIIGGFNMALFFDMGNIWMNGRGESRDEAGFRFSNFYKELALNTGAGIRYDLDFFILRLDWGLKLYNPNNVESKRWLGNLGLNQTALHFAIGLPF